MKFHIVLWIWLLSCIDVFTATLDPVTLSADDVIVDDMIYGRDQYFKEYFNIR